MSENEQRAAISSLIKGKVLKHEYLLILFLIIAVAIPNLNIQEGNLISILILGALAVIYFISSYIVHEIEGITARDLFVYKIGSIASAITTMSILFDTQSWPNSAIMGIVGAVSLFICLTYIVVQNRNKSKSEIFSQAFVLRIIVLLIISAGLIL